MSKARDPRREADAYIRKHRIDFLFQELGTRLCYARAEDPNAFLLEALEEMKANRSNNKTTQFFTNEDVSSDDQFLNIFCVLVTVCSINCMCY